MKKAFSAKLDVRRRTSTGELRLDSWHGLVGARASTRHNIKPTFQSQKNLFDRCLTYNRRLVFIFSQHVFTLDEMANRAGPALLSVMAGHRSAESEYCYHPCSNRGENG
jgi:hypothetical protein